METTIVWDDEEKVAHIYTAIPMTIRKLDKLCAAHADQYKCIWVDKDGKAKKYEMPSRYVRFGTPMSEECIVARKKRWEDQTDEQKRAVTERLAKYRRR